MVFLRARWPVMTALLVLAACLEQFRAIHRAAPNALAASPAVSCPSAPAIAPVAVSGPCTGKPAGEAACDGRSLLRCETSAGATSLLGHCLDIERCDAERGVCVADCPRGEVYVPATGAQGFTMGRGKVPFGFGSRASGNEGHGIADTPHQVVLTKPFCMDATEVTVGAYAICVENQKCTPPGTFTHWIVFPSKLDHPVNMVTWRQAKSFCEAVGKTLPTEAQWEWAASGMSGSKFPWGDTAPTCDEADFTAGTLSSPACDCGCSGGGTSTVGSHPKGDKVWPAGTLHDLAGNVWEWCLDNYRAYKPVAETDPLHVTEESGPHVVRGGGWNRSAVALMTSFRGTAVVDYQRPALGFRCVRNPRED